MTRSRLASHDQPHSATPSADQSSAAAAVSPRVKLWLDSAGTSVFCAGLAAMLRAVDRTHSIKAAAADFGRSYRFVWARIKEAETALGATLVTAQVGGAGTHRSELTPLAQALLHEYDAWQQELAQLIEQSFAPRLAAVLSGKGS